ncbi:MAG TPA: hypothetical protein VJV78_00355 [Polyangiales bacterium]|nr:hypothetical protein [Polyangiales bacterium]
MDVRGLGIAIFVGATGCVSAPEPPAVPTAVVALAEAYKNPSAALNATTARMVVDQTLSQRQVLSSISGLRFIRDVIANATSIDDSNLDSVDVRGALDARAACPGWDPTAPADESIDGFIELSIGIEESRVQRAFGGTATNCRFVTQSQGQLQNAQASMDLELDLGGSLGLGEPTPPILVRATNLSGSVGSLALNLGQQVVSFRIGADDTIETLVNMTTLPAGSQGTTLIRLRADGAWSLRARDGAWLCSPGGSTPCVRDTGA